MALKHRRIRILSWLTALATGAGLWQGCITTPEAPSTAPAADVIERSREFEPPWTAFSQDSIHENSENLKYVRLENGVLDLPVGIKTAQLQALSGSQSAFQSFAAEVVLRHLAGAGGATEGASLVNLKTEAFLVADDIHRELARVADIYFEKYRAPEHNDGMYRVFVLVAVPKTALNDLFRVLAGRLATSSTPELRRIAPLLRGGNPAGVSH